MGDRICIQITDGEDISPVLYCHWAGLSAIKAVHDVLPKSRNEVQNVMCNLIVDVMGGECSSCSFYIYNAGECDGIADYDNWSWTFNIRTRTWSTTDPAFMGRTLTIEDTERYVKDSRPCLYRDCPCDLYDTDEYCQKRLWDDYCRAHPEAD